MKNMLNIIIYTIILLVIYGFMAKTAISFKPFSISFARPYLALGWLLIASGVLSIQYDSERKGAYDLIDKMKKLLDEAEAKAIADTTNFSEGQIKPTESYDK
jgi:hypothetical protein